MKFDVRKSEVQVHTKSTIQQVKKPNSLNLFTSTKGSQLLFNLTKTSRPIYLHLQKFGVIRSK